MINSCLLVIWQSLLVWGSLNTIQSHVYLLSNLHSVMVIPILLILRKSVHKFEKIAFVSIMISAALLLMDRLSFREDQIVSVKSKVTHKTFYTVSSSLYVDLVVISSNLAAALFFLLNRSLTKSAPSFLGYIATLNGISTFIFCVIAVLGEDATIDFNTSQGLFGWLDNQISFVTIFFYGFLATFFGSAGYLFSLQFYSPLVVMNAHLLEPIIAQVLGCVMGIDKLPSFLTVTALMAVAISTFFLNQAMNIMIDDKKRDGGNKQEEILEPNDAINYNVANSSNENDSERQIRMKILKMENRVLQIQEQMGRANPTDQEGSRILGASLYQES